MARTIPHHIRSNLWPDPDYHRQNRSRNTHRQNGSRNTHRQNRSRNNLLVCRRKKVHNSQRRRCKGTERPLCGCTVEQSRLDNRPSNYNHHRSRRGRTPRRRPTSSGLRSSMRGLCSHHIRIDSRSNWDRAFRRNLSSAQAFLVVASAQAFVDLLIV